MMTERTKARPRVADVLDKPGPPFQNWVAEVGARLTVLLTTLAQLSELAVSQCEVCHKVDSVGWMRVGDHRVCRRFNQD